MRPVCSRGGWRLPRLFIGMWSCAGSGEVPGGTTARLLWPVRAALPREALAAGTCTPILVLKQRARACLSLSPAHTSLLPHQETGLGQHLGACHACVSSAFALSNLRTCGAIIRLEPLALRR